MASIGSLTADLKLESAAFIRDLSKASAQVAKNTSAMQRSFARVQQSVSSLATGLGAFISLRTARRVVTFTEDVLKLASAMEGPLGDAARQMVKSGEELENSFKLGFATGLINEFAGQLTNTNDQLREMAKLGSTVGSVVGRAFKEIGIFAQDLKGFLTDINTLIAGFHAITMEGLFPGPGSSHAKTGGSTPLGLPSPEEIRQFTEGTAAAEMATEEFWNATVKMTEAGKALHETFREAGQTMDAVRTPLEQYRYEIEKLREQLAAGAIDAESFGRAQMMAAATAISPWLQVADTIGGALGTLFKDNKAVAIAQAVINTAQGITAALAQYPPPLSFAMAAAQAAAGAAQIAVIASTNPGSGSKSAAFKGGGSAKSAKKAGEASSASSGPMTSITLQIKGDVFGPEHFKKMVKGINGAVSDGSVLVRMT